MNRYISIRQILDNLLRHPMLDDLSLESVVNYTIDFIRIIGMPRVFQDKTAMLSVREHRAELPCDFHEIIQVRLLSGSDTPCFRHTTDSFHMSPNKPCDPIDLTYKIQGQVIYTSVKEGDIEIAYKSIAVDDEGFPMIPDNSSFTRALELYIKKQCFTVLFDLGKLSPQVYNNVCQEYAWAVGQAQSDLVRPTIDQMQAFSNSFNTLIPRTNEHRRGFVRDGGIEGLKH